MFFCGKTEEVTISIYTRSEKPDFIFIVAWVPGHKYFFPSLCIHCEPCFPNQYRNPALAQFYF
jgi:hypothetical protein